MNTNEADQLVAPFMVAEFETLTSRILNIDQTRTTRINFYIIIVTAAISIGGLLLVSQNPSAQAMYQILVPLLSLIVFLFGIATLNEYIELAASAVFLYRRAGRIRCWFHDMNPSISRYLAWTAGDDTPPFKDEIGYAIFTGKDSILLLGNSLSAAVLTFSLLWVFISLPPAASIALAVIVFAGIWVSQDKYISYLRNKYEEVGRADDHIHFPRDERSSTPDDDTK